MAGKNATVDLTPSGPKIVPSSPKKLKQQNLAASWGKSISVVDAQGKLKELIHPKVVTKGFQTPSLQCKHCFRSFANMGSLVQHEKCCSKVVKTEETKEVEDERIFNMGSRSRKQYTVREKVAFILEFEDAKRKNSKVTLKTFCATEGIPESTASICAKI
jgi:hypothetical protein